jgi:uncharacterized membrane protein required for colicin V production
VEVLQRLQALDILFVIVWAGIVSWGLQTGIVRQIGMLIGVYAAALLSGSVYKQGGRALAFVFGPDLQPRLEFVVYVLFFVVVFGLIAASLWRTYPASRFSRLFGTENLVGAALGAVWGALFLIALLTILRFYVAVPWRGQETTQQGIHRQIRLSQVAPVLEVVAAPLWQVMVPWFPTPVTPVL